MLSLLLLIIQAFFQNSVQFWPVALKITILNFNYYMLLEFFFRIPFSKRRPSYIYIGESGKE